MFWRKFACLIFSYLLLILDEDNLFIDAVNHGAGVPQPEWAGQYPGMGPLLVRSKKSAEEFPEQLTRISNTVDRHSELIKDIKKTIQDLLKNEFRYESLKDDVNAINKQLSGALSQLQRVNDIAVENNRKILDLLDSNIVEQTIGRKVRDELQGTNAELDQKLKGFDLKINDCSAIRKCVAESTVGRNPTPAILKCQEESQALSNRASMPIYFPEGSLDELGPCLLGLEMLKALLFQNKTFHRELSDIKANMNNISRTVKDFNDFIEDIRRIYKTTNLEFGEQLLEQNRNFRHEVIQQVTNMNEKLEDHLKEYINKNAAHWVLNAVDQVYPFSPENTWLTTERTATESSYGPEVEFRPIIDNKAMGFCTIPKELFREFILFYPGENSPRLKPYDVVLNGQSVTFSCRNPRREFQGARTLTCHQRKWSTGYPRCVIEHKKRRK